jgi:hypothetical protein
MSNARGCGTTSTKSTFMSISERDLNQALLWLCVFGLVLSLLRGIRSPNIWSAMHYQLDYSMGFLKRAFAGQVLSLMGVERGSYSEVFFISFAITFISVAAFVLLIIRSRLHCATGGLFFILLFVNSYGLVYYFHTVGYLGHILMVLFIASIFLFSRPSPWSSLIGSGLFASGILVHEIMAVVFAPVLIVFLLVQERMRLALLLSAIIVAFTAATNFLAVKPDVTPEELNQLLQSKASFPIRADFAYILYMDGAEHFRAHIGRVLSPGFLWAFLPSLILFCSISFILMKASLTAISLARVRDDGIAKPRIGFVLARYAIPIACFSPLLLNFVAWDAHRWNALTVNVSLSCLCMIRIAKPSAPPPCPTKATVVVGLMFMFMNLTANYGMFDNYVAEGAPFIQHIDYVRGVIEGTRDFPQVPPR